MKGGSKQTPRDGANVEDVLARAAAVRAESRGVGTTSTGAPRKVKGKLPDRVVLIVDGEHYMAPIGDRDPATVAEALHRFIQKRNRPSA